MRFLSTLTLALVTACVWKPTPVVMVGPIQEVSLLAGEWSGEYFSSDTQRSGSIWFKLEAGRDTAFGDVLMLPRENVMTMMEPSAPQPMKEQPRVLTIRFVRVRGQELTGAIDPYPSPDCGCTLVTVFRGDLKGDRIEGDFVTQHTDEAKSQAGRWWVARKKSDAR